MPFFFFFLGTHIFTIIHTDCFLYFLNHQVVVKALNYVCDVNPSLDHIGPDVKLAFFNETRHAFGRTALLLSGGAGLGFYHVGFVKALFDQVRERLGTAGEMEGTQ